MARRGRPTVEITLSAEERETLLRWGRRHSSSQALALRCRIVLACAEANRTHAQIAGELGCNPVTVSKWRHRFAADRLDGLVDAPRPGAARTVGDDVVEAVVVETLETAPPDATHWSTRGLAAKHGISHTTVREIWRAFGLKPWRQDEFKVSPDPDLVEKIRDIVALYMNPPVAAAVFAVDEKPQIQALNRTAPTLPMLPTTPARATHDYERHGTCDLFAALEIATGKVITDIRKTHTSADFVAFLNKVNRNVPKDPSRGNPAVMRVTTLKGTGEHLARLVDYYVGLAEDQQRRDGGRRGPVDYYLDPDEPPGRWWGRGCPAVDLAGDVEPDQLARMLEGRHPVGGERLGRRFSEKSARGFDATFSAAKSVSVLWALSPDPWVQAEVLAAHDDAVVAALEWLQRHGAVTRRGTDGVDQVDTRGLVAALFRQHTSRSVDPQLHSHAVLWSKVRDPTGKWLSLDARFLKRQQRSMSWVYDAALRAELTGRLGVAWGPVQGGQADLVAVPPELREAFSQRSEQVEAKLGAYVRRWSDEHGGAEPDARTIGGLERDAARDSRPAKVAGQHADSVRAEWAERAVALGFDGHALRTDQLRLERATGFDREAVLDEALERVASDSSTWLQADLAREIATLVPPGAASTATNLVAVVDELAEEAAGRCSELHPAPVSGVSIRSDGRPVTEHVIDRRLSTRSVMDQERRLLNWAGSAVEVPAGPSEVGADDHGLDPAQAQAARAVASSARLVLVVGPAGTGKTTTLAAAVSTLRSERRHVLGAAPSGKAADVLAGQAGCPAVTLAKLLATDGRRGAPAGTTVLLDEAGMASTQDLDRLATMVQRHSWRLVCVGDPEQLPSVGRGGMFTHWCDTLPAVRLEEVRRFVEPWEADASLLVRAGQRQGVDAYDERGRLQTTHPALVADRVARRHQSLAAKGRSVAITTTTAATARAVNLAIQHAERNWHSGPSVRLADATRAWAGDRIATRRNDRTLVTDAGAEVRNRQSWTVTRVGPDGSLTVQGEKGKVTLPADYVARHVELGWAVTGYGNQGVTVDHGLCVVEPTSRRAGVYVGMTRGRLRNDAFVVDPAGDDPAEALTAIVERPANALTAHAVRDRLHGHSVVDVVDDRSQLIEHLDRLQRRPTPAREPLGLS